MILTISMRQVDRVVHGGEKLPESVAITDEVEKEIEELSELAPLHNPANLMGIRAFRKFLPNIPHVAIFHTAFSQTMPEKAYLYSLPYHYYKDYGIRKYGFHGTSHHFYHEEQAEMLISQLKIYVLFHVTLVMEHQLQLSMAVNLLIHQWASHHLLV